MTVRRANPASRRAAPTGRMLLCVLAVFAAAGAAACGRDESPHRVYVMLGFHANFYHSWRGDTPDEAGFGTDIRLVRFLLDELDRANAEGLDARAYWDHDNLFTLETILPAHAPDILRKLRRRIDAGLDEVVLGAYANGLTGAMTERELRATVRWAVSNPWGSGVRDLFGHYTPLFRPQEGMLTTGAIPILQQEGVVAVALAYSEWPFNAFSNFVPPLRPEQRYGVTWLRLRKGGPRIALMPVMSIGDVLNHVSFERWMLDLRALQTSGRVDRDLLLHMNFDADVESWLPQDLPPGLGWLPNAGGLREYIEAVNEYDWAEFTTPGEVLASHEPVGEVWIRQDTADGAYDGHGSWAEKFPSHRTWTDLERSRLLGRRALDWLAALEEAGAADSGLSRQVDARLFEGRDSSFFQRLRGLSTTHFGMSTPVLNEERQAVARRVAAGARDRAREALRLSAARAAGVLLDAEEGGAFLARIAVRDGRAAGAGEKATSLVRLPLLFAQAPPPTRLVDARGAVHPHSWVNIEWLDGAWTGELWVALDLGPGETRILTLQSAPELAAPAGTDAEAAADVFPTLANAGLELRLGRAGVESLRAGDWRVGGSDLLSPFITYRARDDEPPRRFGAGPFRVLDRGAERLAGLARARTAAPIAVETPDGVSEGVLRVDWSLLERAPWLVVDVDVRYPATPKRDVLHTTQQKLRRPLDLRWVEVGPFPLTPRLEAGPEQPAVVWKHNFLGAMSSYPLDYGRINPRNAELDAFNHQITAGWVAVSDRRRGLLLADSADVNTSFAFAPMRLRLRDGRQVVSINPFGTWHGRQLAYDHLGGNGIGTEFTTLASSAVRPNGPSYNGERERFSLLVAPYRGDAPPARLRADAEAFFHPPAAVVRTAGGVFLPSDLRAAVDERRRAEARRRTGPIAVPRAFLANPSDGAVDLVWDAAGDARVIGYEIQWREAGETAEAGAADGSGGSAAGWRSLRVGRRDRRHIDGLENGRSLLFRLRALAAVAEEAGGGERAGDWTATREVTVGPVEVVDPKGAAEDAPLWLLVRTFWYGLVHWATTL